jgi:hypothetical protein
MFERSTEGLHGGADYRGSRWSWDSPRGGRDLLAVEQESGVSTGRVHAHNGYWAGDFPTPESLPPCAWQAPIPAFDPAG